MRSEPFEEPPSSCGSVARRSQGASSCRVTSLDLSFRKSSFPGLYLCRILPVAKWVDDRIISCWLWAGSVGWEFSVRPSLSGRRGVLAAGGVHFHRRRVPSRAWIPAAFEQSRSRLFASGARFRLASADERRGLRAATRVHEADAHLWPRRRVYERSMPRPVWPVTLRVC